MPINITFGISLNEIYELTDRTQLLITKVEIRESWVDTSLAWNKSDFEGLAKIVLRPESIWRPDIVLYNNAGEDFGDGQTRTNAVVTSDGLVSMTIPSILKTSCKIDATRYPFDKQSCPMIFGSWTYDGNLLSIKMESHSADLSEYSENVEWELVSAEAKFHSKLFVCCPDTPFEEVTYTIVVKRRSLYYIMYLIIPAVAIALLTLLVFLLPPECSERMTVGMAILVGLSFFFLLVAESMPVTTEAVPVIGRYYTITMIQVSCAFFMSCWVLRFHYSKEDVPPWVKVYLLGYAARILRFKFAESNIVKDAKELKQDEVTRSAKGHILCSEQGNNLQKPNHSDPCQTQTKKAQEDPNRLLWRNIRQQEVVEARQDEWRRAALVLNSIFMYLYFIGTVLSVICILLIPAVGQD
ncbi:neuronal acetylcholine receptor subunit alpha-10 isoform X2 [Nematostella vectensis]|nr:neuronal acetylcholine receptor subunit alpha-10 isoform X2 [Nematostella vectensis]